MFIPSATMSSTTPVAAVPRWQTNIYGGRHTFLCRFSTFFSVLYILFLIQSPLLDTHPPEFRVDSASVDRFNVDESDLSATWDISIFVRNPNEKLSIRYHNLEAWIVYGGEQLLWGEKLHPLFLKKRKESRVTAQFEMAFGKVVKVFTGQFEMAFGKVGKEALRAISGDRARGSVSFDVKLLALVTFNNGWEQTMKRLMRVSCHGVEFGFSAPNNGTGTLMGGPRACKVDLQHFLCMCRNTYYKDSSIPIIMMLMRNGRRDVYECGDIFTRSMMKFVIDDCRTDIFN